MTKLFFCIGIMLCLFACKTDTTQDLNRPTGAELAVRWELVASNIGGENRYSTRFTIINQSEDTLHGSGWTIYFNQISGSVISEGLSPDIVIERITGDFYKMQPSSVFMPVPPGDSVMLNADFRGWLIKEAEAPQGLYIVFENEDGSEQQPEVLSNYTISPISLEMAMRGSNDKTPIPTAAWQYEQNAKITPLPFDDVPKIIPTPNRILTGNATGTLDASWKIQYQKGLQKESAYLSARLNDIFNKALEAKEGGSEGAKTIMLKLNPQLPANESYKLAVSANSITIEGKDAAGVFYGIQSLLSWLPPDAFKGNQQSLTFQEVQIEDAPRFGYRGLHLDVSRNFHSKASVLKLLDLMAFYKLNKFHIHMADDEGWRLEIPTLPRLTQVGASRGHTLTEEDRIYPAYGSGPFPDPKVSHGSGYYSKADFMEILRKATDRHIEVIVEFDTPGHARAAIKAMQSRYKKLMETGLKAEAEAFLLHDPADSSKYESVQGYPDNVICVCRESVYNFWETVIDDLQKMYTEAGAPLNTIHIGGDEVPAGVWEKSPICNELKAKNPDLKTTEDLAHYYLRRVNELLLKRGLNTGGWEEIAMKKEGNRYVPNPVFADKKLMAYVWINLWGNQDMANRLANAGFPVVLCNVTNLYFDLAYNKDPNEPGLYWGGFVDTRKPYEFIPEDILKSTTVDPMGNAFNLNDYKNMERLTPQGLSNVLGIQAQLWSETLKGQDMLEYYLLPKLLGLAERAWAQQPDWARINNLQERETALDQAWSIFANTVGQRDLPRLNHLFGGWNYRIAPPGVVVEKGILMANNNYPGFEIRYTEDGSEPTMNATLYKEPVKVNGTIKLKAFDARGRSSRTVTVNAGELAQ